MLVNSIFHFPTHMVFFTTPELLEIGGLPLVTPFDKPTRLESLRYYRRVVDSYGIQISFHEEVVEIARQGDVFVVTTAAADAGIGAGRDAAVRRRRRAPSCSRSGTDDIPNYLGVPARTCRTSRTTTRSRIRTIASGSSSSAARIRRPRRRSSSFARARTSRSCTGGRRWATSIKYWVRPDIENRIKEGSIAARFETRVVEITPDQSVVVEQAAVAGREEIPADAVLLLTGYRPDVDLMRRAGIRATTRRWRPI